jgi:uncharacterized protein with von Willebrand factor type A (vWA) domain
LKHRDIDVALARVTTAVSDWAGGTRIGSSPRGVQPALVAPAPRAERRRAPHQRWLEADAGEDLGKQTERLHKSCRRLIWLNPLLRYEGFEARPAGIKAMLPHVDDFLPVHNFDSLTALAEALSVRSREGLDREPRARWQMRAR